MKQHYDCGDPSQRSLRHIPVNEINDLPGEVAVKLLNRAVDRFIQQVSDSSLEFSFWFVRSQSMNGSGTRCTQAKMMDRARETNRAERHTLTVHLTCNKTSSLSSTVRSGNFNPVYKSISSLAPITFTQRLLRSHQAREKCEKIRCQICGSFSSLWSTADNKRVCSPCLE